jgi:RimJ/RimL family protein N-acetyltransferase
VHLQLGNAIVRPWSLTDLPSLVHHANDRAIWQQLRDRFPSPYTENDGRAFLTMTTSQPDVLVWAIDVDGQAVGGIGLERRSDVERVSAEIGYWLAQPYWNRGIVTAAVRSVTARAFDSFDLSRIFALPFADNVASRRVLEKAGYVVEGRLRQSAIKDGRLKDQILFAAYRTAAGV